jgi:hypothetical protein
MKYSFNQNLGLTILLGLFKARNHAHDGHDLWRLLGVQVLLVLWPIHRVFNIPAVLGERVEHYDVITSSVMNGVGALADPGGIASVPAVEADV